MRSFAPLGRARAPVPTRAARYPVLNSEHPSRFGNGSAVSGRALTGYSVSLILGSLVSKHAK
jgi:hypothetical protein